MYQFLFKRLLVYVYDLTSQEKSCSAASVIRSLISSQLELLELGLPKLTPYIFKWKIMSKPFVLVNQFYFYMSQLIMPYF